MDSFLQPDGSPKEYMTSDPVPFFIELNRCLDHIADWYSDSLRKTNFITRYIGQIKENHSSLDSVSDETLDMIEKELQKIPSGGKPQYVLLLDGFNEVRADHSVRTYLSGEISALRHYSNVRIITTSRETQAAYYASEFENIHLVGVGLDDIVAWATRGFVLEKSLETKLLLHPKCYTWRGNRKIIIDKVFKPLEMIYVWHTSELTNQYGCGRTNCSFIYLSDDMTEAIFVENRQKLLYCENIKELTYEVLAEKMKKCSSNANQNAFWDFAVPQNNLNILGCYEFYNLMEVDSTDNTLLNPISYYPGISIVGCNFDNAITDETVQSIINSNSNDNSNTI